MIGTPTKVLLISETPYVTGRLKSADRVQAAMNHCHGCHGGRGMGLWEPWAGWAERAGGGAMGGVAGGMRRPGTGWGPGLERSRLWGP